MPDLRISRKKYFQSFLLGTTYCFWLNTHFVWDLELKIHQQTQNSGTLWQKDYFDRIIRDWDHFVNVARYIRRNPLKAKLREGEFLLEEADWIKRLLA
jgi:hypothetical protein